MKDAIGNPRDQLSWSKTFYFKNYNQELYKVTLNISHTVMAFKLLYCKSYKYRAGHYTCSSIAWPDTHIQYSKVKLQNITPEIQGL